ncbi:MAG: GTPase Era [Rhodospirillales bacterium]
MNDTKTRAGFIAILGAPNVGKSTLVNRLVGAKVSIVSPKVQTTRTRVLGIFIEGPAQVILIDTPGIFEPKGRLDRAMVAAAWSGAQDADAVALLIDAKDGVDKRSQAIIDKLTLGGRKAYLILNKIDLVAKPVLLSLAEKLMNTGVFTDCFMVSANTGDGVSDLAKLFAATVPEGPWLYPEDEISDMPARLLAAEITREKLFLKLHQELPYKITVETEDWEQRTDGSAHVRQVIYVERDSQKGIVLGRQGAMVKQIGAAARTELQDLLGHPVHLFIHVKVRGKWQDDRERYAEWGLDFDA